MEHPAKSEEEEEAAAQRRTSISCSTNSSSPEFQFWATPRNNPLSHPLLSADELFADGVLLPLHLLKTPSHNPPPPHNPSSTPLQPDPPPPPLPPPASSSSISAPTSTLTSSKRWKDIILFKKAIPAQNHDEDKEKKAKKKKTSRDKKTQASASGGSSSAELNINIWPFSRSRSAGNGATRPKLFPPGSTRKVSSAPCSRSNSAGESKFRKWPSSPGRVNGGGGVYLGRSSPVWQVRRGGGSGAVRSSEKGGGSKKGINYMDGDGSSNSNSNGSGGSSMVKKGLNLKVPKCIGYGHHLSCTSDESSALNAAGSSGTSCRAKNGGADGANATTTAGVGSNAAANLFNFRSLFTKKGLLIS